MAEYKESMGHGLPVPKENPSVLVRRTEANVDLSDHSLPTEVAGKKFDVHWSGFLTPIETGDFLLGIRADGFSRVTVDDKQVAGGADGTEVSTSVGRVHLERGQKVALSIMYGSSTGHAHAELVMARVNNAPSPAAWPRPAMRRSS